MAILKILTYPDPFLRTKAKPVDPVDDGVRALAADMIQTMLDAPGAGLASIQVGSDKALIVYDLPTEQGEHNVRTLVNPEIVTFEGEQLSENEGCLSLPDFRADVKRAAEVRVKALDPDGNPLDFTVAGYHAVVLQHEIDHLNGVLFIDHISSLKRELYKRRVRKQMKG